MILRRLPMVAVTGATLVTAVVLGRSAPDVADPVFSDLSAAAPWMPAVPAKSGLSTTWFCPGVPASGDEGVGGEIVVANADAAPIDVRISLLGETGIVTTQDLTVAAQTRETVDVDELVTTPYASAVVEVTGGTGVVEQIARRPIGEAESTSTAACTTSTSSNWYLSEGFTAEGSTEELVLTNPSPTTSQVAVDFATQEGSRQPTDLRSFTVPPQSVRVIDMSEYAARDESEVAVSVVATRGSILVARAQLYGGTNRRGYAVSLAAPAARDQWWFVDGEVGEGITERYSIYNPGDESIEVTPVILGQATDELVPIEPIAVRPRQVTTFSPADIEGIPTGRHAMVFSTNPGEVVVVERAITRTFDGLPTTSVVMGATPRHDGFVPTTWSMAVGVQEAAEEALVVYNIDQADATVTVQAVGPGGPVDVAGLTAIPLAANGLITIDLVDDAVVGRQLIVRSSARVFVERLLPRSGGALGRVGSWPLPAGG